jgi:SAM-dependent methyltransferase
MSEFQPQYRQQDVKFVEMSRELTADHYDIRRILEKVRALGRGQLRILDVGGGIGSMAAALADALPQATVDVIDLSPLARDNFIVHERTSLIVDDFLRWEPEIRYDVVIFRTVLHHIVGPTESETRASQHRAIEKASGITAPGGKLFVVENFYDPIATEDFTGRMIYYLTRSKAVAWIARRLGANTAGEGVRFRSFRSWSTLFASHGYEILDVLRAPKASWYVPVWQRAPVFCADCYQALVELKRH